jgi:trimeric autotransporter adhesin
LHLINRSIPVSADPQGDFLIFVKVHSMNKSYKSVWNESTGSWVAVSELATGRSKSKRAKTAISKAILTQIAIGGMSLAGASVAMADPMTPGTVSNIGSASGNNSVVLGAGSDGSQNNVVSVGAKGTERKIVNVAAGTTTTDAVNYGQLNAAIASVGTGGTTLITQPTAGTGDLLVGSAVAGTHVNFANSAGAARELTGVAEGTTDTSAVNLSQLKAAGLNIDTSGNATNAFVAYSTTAKDLVTLGGAAGTKISNVTAGGLSATSMDAVNGSQLFNTGSTTAAALGGGSTMGADGKIKAPSYSLAGSTYTDVGSALTAVAALAATGSANGVAYDTTAHDTVTLNGTAGTTLSNVKAGVADTDAVNVKQLTAAGLSIDTNGNVTNSFVAYDDASKSGITLGNGTSGAQIHNLVAGTTGTDAVNLQQLTDAGLAVDTSGHVTNSFVAYDDSTKGVVTFGGGTAGTRLANVAAGFANTDAVNVSQLAPVVAGLGGGAAIDSKTGKVTGPTYVIQGNTYGNAGDAFTKVDGSLTNLTNTVNAITTETGKGLVAQDATTENITVGALTGGTVVDLTNASGVQRKLTGVAAGDVSSSSFDAINGSQLFSAGSGIATAIGGGAAMNSDGSFTQPSFNLANPAGGTVQLHNVADAISNLDGRTTSNANNLIQLQDQVTNIAAGGGVATPNAVAYDSSAHDTLTLASTAGGTTKLSGLTDGSLAAGSTDAVTGNQLNATNADVAALQTSVQNISSTGSTSIGINGADGVAGTAGAAGANGADAIAMGDNASASGNGAIVIGGGATAAGDGTIAIGGNAGASGKDSIAIGNGATAPANNAVALGANSVADRDNSVSVGSADQQRQITNVAAGTQGTDAVNLNQMNSAVGGIARKAYSGIAAATALTMIPDVDANKTLSLGIGGGTFQGYAATAIGGTARITQNIKVRVGAGWSAAGTTVGAGASYQW